MENARIGTARPTLTFEVLKWRKTDPANVSRF